MCAPARAHTYARAHTGSKTNTQLAAGGAPASGATAAGTRLAGKSLAGGLTSALARSTAGANAEGAESPLPVAPSTLPPPGRRLSSEEVLRIADRLPLMRRERARHRGSYRGAYLKGPGRWQVSYFAKGGKEIGQVIISDTTGRVLEQWTGFQVAWTMARGYPGAFGRHVNALYIWLPLCLLFLVPFIDRRRIFSLRHLDLLALLSFSVSLAFFNHGDIYASVPLTYPPLVYLLLRMLALAGLGRRGRSPESAHALVSGSPGSLASEPHHSLASESLRSWIPAPWLALGVVFLLGFRVALNVTDSNVVDVGYAGVIGAQRIVHGRPLYGHYPSDNEHGDTYGPVNYELYVPFEQIFGWSGTWDDLPAAHAAAVFFDLLAVGLIFLLGLRIRGPTLGVTLAYAWVSYPFTLYALESNSNDTLLAALLLATLLVASSPPARGTLAALTGLTKFAPLALAPLFATHGLRELPARRRPLAFVLFLAAFAATAALVAIPALAHDSLHEIYERTLAYQANRGAPFSLWGLYGGLQVPQHIVQALAVALALALAVIPRRPGIPALAAAAAAILIALQLGIEYWFYLYIPWFFPLVLVALFAPRAAPTPPPVAAVAASEPARSSPLAVA
ncbi:MAG TPA: hypothetical protein VMS02_03845 [Solirubrobacteraceae bacterium]|nr:hypothetical protein [Solirubrobacteraceae bacterium]